MEIGQRVRISNIRGEYIGIVSAIGSGFVVLEEAKFHDTQFLGTKVFSNQSGDGWDFVGRVSIDMFRGLIGIK